MYIRLIQIIALTMSMAGPACCVEDDPAAMFGECTIGVFDGNVTADGRPLLWKNRDVGNRDQRFIYCGPYQRNGITTLAFTGNCYRVDTTRIYMGANQSGFAIMNSDSYNLGDSLVVGMDDGMLMRLALETCRTLEDFEALLDSTDSIGRLDCWNIGCFDSTGACAMYECANYWYFKCDPNNMDSPAPGYIIRANYSFCGGNNKTGIDRFKRAAALTAGKLLSGRIDAQFVLECLTRDLGNVFADPYPLPYHGSQVGAPPGYIYNLGITIANRSTSSATVIRGVSAGESPDLTTIFAVLGPPILSVGVPLWVKSQLVPLCLTRPQGAPMIQYCDERSLFLYDNPQAIFHLNSRYLLDDDGAGVYSYTLPLESWGIRQADLLMQQWSSEQPTVADVYLQQFRISSAIFAGFQHETSDLIIDTPSDPSPLPNAVTLANYPNPFNDGTLIFYSGAENGHPVSISIYDLMGRLMIEFPGNIGDSGSVYWAGEDSFGNRLVSGVYFCALKNGPFVAKNKMIFLK